MKKLCRKSGKVKFDTHEQAAQRAGEVLNKPRRINDPAKPVTALGTYKCPHYNHWHLTSKIDSITI